MHAFIPSIMRECIHEDKTLDLGRVSELALEDRKVVSTDFCEIFSVGSPRSESCQ